VLKNLKNRTEWKVIRSDGTRTQQLFEMFGDRYDYTMGEKEVFRLSMLFGLEDNEIITIMQISANQLDNYFTCMLGKSRTNTIRELQALFLRYLLNKLPA